MSYSRFGAEGSDVYVFTAVDRGLECCGCILQERKWVDDPDYPILRGYFKAVGERIHTSGMTTDEMLAHLDRHRAAGHHIPGSLIEGLEEDRDENDEYRREVLARDSHRAESASAT